MPSKKSLGHLSHWCTQFLDVMCTNLLTFHTCPILLLCSLMRQKWHENGDIKPWHREWQWLFQWKGELYWHLKMNNRGKTMSLNMTQKILTIPHSHCGWCLVSLITFENAGTSLNVVVVWFIVIVAQPTTVGRGGNTFEVTFELFRPVFKIWHDSSITNRVKYYNSLMNKDQHSYWNSACPPSWSKLEMLNGWWGFSSSFGFLSSFGISSLFGFPLSFGPLSLLSPFFGLLSGLSSPSSFFGRSTFPRKCDVFTGL